MWLVGRRWDVLERSGSQRRREPRTRTCRAVSAKSHCSYLRYLMGGEGCTSAPQRRFKYNEIQEVVAFVVLRLLHLTRRVSQHKEKP